MFSVAARREVRAPIETAFDYLADLRNEMRWNPNARQIVKLDDHGVRSGSRFTADYQGAGALDVEVLECSAPNELRYLSRAKLMSFISTIQLQPLPSGTLVNLAMDVEPHGVLRLIAPFMGIML